MCQRMNGLQGHAFSTVSLLFQTIPQLPVASLTSRSQAGQGSLPSVTNGRRAPRLTRRVVRVSHQDDEIAPGWSSLAESRQLVSQPMPVTKRDLRHIVGQWSHK